ncbi:MAG: cation:proton antiporter [Gammaproteobacteria bacterium]|jgi:Kef-type K+ transport system membrane component KefB|nr:cation:proton antiporter [Gammaproteobacteria bacterium]MDP6537480.1 cation:proton antiporter [Gammaproteobacteria bacterium]MDP6734103.1 cation:proton antiporter [Gammaproteobacteria bacterium]|tara:strand:+ start:553 stop:1851 length:1299 start_codon:yes stop_codon:yes gene_type:complete
MNDMIFLAVIWAGVFLSYFMAHKTKLTPVLFFLFFGSSMVNLGILPEESSEFIRGFSEIGIILIMFALGFEEDTSNFIQGIKRSWGIALFGALAPFSIAYYVTLYYWQDPRLSIMCGLAMTATAVSLTMVSIKSEHLQNTQASTGIMTAAILDDIASLAAVAILVPLATGDAEITAAGILLIVVKAIAFFFIITLLEIFIFPHSSNLKIYHKIPIFNRFGIKHFIAFSKGEQTTLAVLLVALVISILSYQFGFHPAVGAYMSGLIIKQEYFYLFEDSEVDYYNHTKKIVDNVAFSWIGPVFFVELGTKIVFDQSILMAVIPQIFVLTAGIIIGQILSAALSARFTGNYQWHESILIGFGMLGRAELAFVVMDIGYVQNSIISTEAFYTLMATCFVLNVLVPVSIMLWKPYFEGTKQLKLGSIWLSWRVSKIE